MSQKQHDPNPFIVRPSVSSMVTVLVGFVFTLDFVFRQSLRSFDSPDDQYGEWSQDEQDGRTKDQNEVWQVVTSVHHINGFLLPWL
jgi:hypothetical protein